MWAEFQIFIIKKNHGNLKIYHQQKLENLLIISRISTITRGYQQNLPVIRKIYLSSAKTCHQQNLPVISRMLHIMCRKQIQTQHCMFTIRLSPLGRIPDTANNQLFHIPPYQLRTRLMNYCDPNAPLDTLMELVSAHAWCVIFVIDGNW